MDGGGEFEPGFEVVGVVGADLSPDPLAGLLGRPLFLSPPTARRHEDERGPGGIEVARVPGPLLVIPVGLPFHVLVGSHLPARDPVGDEGVARLDGHEAVPPAELHALPGPEADNGRLPHGREHQAAEEPWELSLGVEAVRPRREVGPVGEGDRLHGMTTVLRVEVGLSRRLLIADVTLVVDEDADIPMPSRSPAAVWGPQ